MSKIINAYNGLTAQNIKDAAELPLQAYMSVNGATVECTHVPVTDIKNVLSSGSTAVSVLCSSGNVNQWANFSSKEWYVISQVVTNRAKTPYTMGSFAGYNHNAITPYSTFPYPLNSFGSAAANTVVQVGCLINLGEYDWSKVNTKCFILADGAVVASFLTSAIVANSEMNVVLNLTAPAIGITKTYAIEVWFGSTSVWQGKLTQCSNSVQIKITVNPTVNSCTAVNTLANRNKAVTKLGLGGGETVGMIWCAGDGLGFAAGNFTGTFNVYADITDSGTSAYLRTVALCDTSIMRGTLSAYKVNGGNTSSTYTVATAVRILPAQGLSYAIPAALLPLADGDNFYLSFDNLY